MQLNITLNEKDVSVDFIMDGSLKTEEASTRIVDLLVYIRSEKFLEDVKTMIKTGLKNDKRDDVVEAVNKLIKAKAASQESKGPKGPMVRPLDVFATPRRRK